MEIEVPFGVESALRAAERINPRVRIEMVVKAGVVKQIDVNDLGGITETQAITKELTKAGFRAEGNRLAWSPFSRSR